MSSSVFKESPELKNIIDTAMYFIVISGFIGPKFKKVVMILKIEMVNLSFICFSGVSDFFF